MKAKKAVLFAFLLMLLIILPSCTRGGGGNNGESQPAERTSPREIEEMEAGTLEILQQADLVPVIERTSLEGEEPKKMEELTFDDAILNEVLKKEIESVPGGGEEEQRLPGEVEEAWDKIKLAVFGLHERWDRLEPQVAGENIPQEIIDRFEGALDQLTAAATGKSVSGTLVAANQLTEYLARFMVPFEEDPNPTAYELKYNVRKIILNAAEDNYEAARDSLSYIREQQPALKKALDEQDASAMAEELNMSLDNLQRALDNEDLEPVKINGAVVMENIVQAIERLR